MDNWQEHCRLAAYILGALVLLAVLVTAATYRAPNRRTDKPRRRG